MAEPSLAFANTDVQLKSAPIRREWIIEGEPTARNQVLSLSHDRMATTLVWDCTAGQFRWIYDVDETIHILEGDVTLTDCDGVTKRLRAGDVVFFPAGSTATWLVHNYVRKLAFFRQPVPKPVSFFFRAYRKLTGMAQDVAGKSMSADVPTSDLGSSVALKPAFPGRREPGFIAFPLEDNQAA